MLEQIETQGASCIIYYTVSEHLPHIWQGQGSGESAKVNI